ncbi:hypothetical protein NEMBOFW57_009374 [Staphylotrichum longicolle]|uniref:carbonic anhydrase n=1 Tax=Staphylotrichum longicolle TaxID=669026 RepID=A0AAD4HXQ4_9PEZI|nr:hypothetical protein NEMBOFW57_009374 [Staphylotrichum longicolle]
MGLTLRALLLLAASATRPRAEEGDEVHVGNFGYIATTGPLNWAALDPAANCVCATGTHQSPINLVDGVFTVLKGSDIQLAINDMPKGAEFENLGTTVEVITQGGTLKIANETFQLKQFHFHLPSEHLDNGTRYSMEMHMVFQSSSQKTAVIGVYISIAQGNPTKLLETVFSAVDKIAVPGTKTKTPPLNMSEVVRLLKANAFQTYSGSLTTPPCTEGVSWLVSTARLTVSPKTFVKARDVIKFNSRFPQNTPGEPNILQIACAGVDGCSSTNPAK